ncbi:major facilitator superfamily domain-containing protein [Cokeromyces recurvatus]|uniref:major facilitator superfamily domain-containing protein n=1 Tax=Cokeromyces recurvatus TaxID=90255 RepID=UPI00221F9314|nr:major facilitator superfamily domain-containing protein [Cokeromyces recurvatus]KAI7906628.1 major facilitator superfamily domain-containing protein [Cokeromyces recurvatus]
MPQKEEVPNNYEENEASAASTLNSIIYSENSKKDEVQFPEDHDNLKQQSTDDLKKSKSWRDSLFLTFIGLQIALFLAALDSTIVSTALPRIGSDFNKMDIVAWVATAYILTFDAFQPLFSKFSDIFGRKLILLFGIFMFLLGSLLCGVAKSMIMLIVCRAIAGIGGAGIFSMVFIIISDLVPLEKRGAFQGVVNAVFALSSVFGPLIGGTFTDYVTWRWNFYINLPIGGVAVIILLIFLHLPIPKGDFMQKLKRIDYLGTALVLLFSTLFLLAMNFGGQTFPWKSAAVIVPLVLTGVFIGALVFVETKVVEPLMPPRLFKIRSVAAILSTNWFFGMSFFSMVYYLPIYFQVIRGDSAMWSGIRLIPMQLLCATFSTLSGLFISKTGIFRPLPSIGMAFLTISVGLLSLLDLTSSFSNVYGFTILGGIGLGCMFSSAIIALQASVPPKDIAVVTGLGNFSRILGGALGVAVSSTILNSTLSKSLPQYVPQDIVEKILASSEYVRAGCPTEYLDNVLDCYLEGLKLIWYVMTAMAGVGFMLSLFVKSAPILKKQQEEVPSNKNNNADQDIEKATPATPQSLNDDDEQHQHTVYEDNVVAVDIQPVKEQIHLHHGGDNLCSRKPPQ